MSSYTRTVQKRIMRRTHGLTRLPYDAASKRPRNVVDRDGNDYGAHYPRVLPRVVADEAAIGG